MGKTTAKDLTIAQLKKMLTEKSKEEIIYFLANLYKYSPSVKQAVNINFNPQYGEKLLAEAQSKIDKLCFPNTKSGIPYNFSISGIKAIVKDFKNVCNDEKLIAQLNLHCAKNLIEFTNTFGDIDESFYNVLERYFYDAAIIIGSYDDMYEKYFQSLENLWEQTYDVGWGLYDELSDTLDRIRR